MQIVLFYLLLLNAKFAFADDMLIDTAPTAQAVDAIKSKKNILKGNSNLGLGLNLDYDSVLGIKYKAQVDYQYFVKDRFAVGLTYDHFYSDRLKSFSIGPKGTYYFYEGQDTAWYISQSFAYNSHKIDYNQTHWSSNSWSSTTSVGMDYFLTPNVSFGPQLYYTTQFGSSSPSDNFGVLLGFKVFF